jgi:spore germination cell wall hydrolase CwlJ-like protein
MPAPVTKKVLANQPLLAEPRDDSDQVVLNGAPLRVFAGEKVDAGAKDSVDEKIHDTLTITWIFVEAISGANVNERKGFVDDRFLVDETEEVPVPGGFKRFPEKPGKDEFADACFVQAELNKTNPAYLFALAFAQSGAQWTANEVTITDPAGAPALGVYQFTQATSDELRKLAELNDIAASEIRFPTAQCVVAAVLASKSADLLKGLITDRGLSAVDLYLAHMFVDDKTFGSNAAMKILEAEKADPKQKSADVIAAHIYPDAGIRTAFLARNKDIFKPDGSATIEEALKTCSDKLAAGFAEAKKVAEDLQKSIPLDVNDPIFGTRFTGLVISVTDQDVDALARVSHSEVGHFGKFSDTVLANALGAVVDTIFNRVIYPTKEFPKTIQGVIDQPKQFSAINPIGTWKGLPAAPPKNFDIVLKHIQARATGADSAIKGATHFFNPDISDPDWGGPIKANPVAKFGTPKDSHIHGFPKGYRPPEGHAIQLGKDAAVFSGDGVHQGQLITPDKSVRSIVAAAIKEWEFWGRSKPGAIAHTDNEVAFATYIRDTYCKPLSATPTLPDISNDKYFWSAVAISYMIKQAGIEKEQFTFAQAHSVYIREAIKACKDKNKDKAFWGFRIDAPEAILAPGDIVGAGRSEGMTFDQAQALFNKTVDYESHSDIVVEVRDGEADLIGGNVSDSVTMKTLKLDAKGRIKDKKNLSFVVMKKL